ncbi:zinc ribbon domain-containing protein [Natronomonas amylolytica]|uniref:zinc ribbon domain-containing protein n=1 Tax=Natronomonas amylolytica TaxID=3108498 RepID=UPI00300A3ACC
MGRQKGADEVFCTSCGAAIKKEAEICPECGVRNENATRPTQSTPTETTVSDSWWYGVGGCLGLWVLVLLLPSDISPAVDALFGLLTVTAWIGLPLSAYFDSKYVGANSDWLPNAALWVIGLLVPLVNVVFGAVYLYRRHEVLGEP